MDELEKVERLRERATVSYEEAKQALEACQWDLLDAMVYLERQGKVEAPEQSSYTTQYEEPKKLEEAVSNTEKEGGAGAVLNRFIDWCKRILKKGNENSFVVERQGKRVVSMPVTLLVMIAILAFWIIFWVLLIGLFFGCRYSFEGPASMTVDMNKAMDSAANAADTIKNEFTK